MCNIYQSTSTDDLVDWFKVTPPTKPYAATIAPLKDGPFIKAGGAVEVGQ